MLQNRSGNTQITPLVTEGRSTLPALSSPLAALMPSGDAPKFPVIQPRVITLDLTNARADAEFQVSGNTLWIPNSTNATDLISVKFDNNLDDAIPLLKGNSLQGVPFRKLFITHSAIAAAILTLVVFNTDPRFPLTLR
jgi:hypothetical protein